MEILTCLKGLYLQVVLCRLWRVGVIKATFITKATVSRCFDSTEPQKVESNHKSISTNMSNLLNVEFRRLHKVSLIRDIERPVNREVCTKEKY